MNIFVYFILPNVPDCNLKDQSFTDSTEILFSRLTVRGLSNKYCLLTFFIKFRLPCQFQRFLYQTLCVFSQMKDTKHIRHELIMSPESCPRGGTLGCPGGQFIFQSWSCCISNRRG